MKSFACFSACLPSTIFLNTGKKIFQSLAQKNGFKIVPTNVTHAQNSNEYVITGPYYNEKDQIWEKQSQGIAFWILDKNGTITSTKNNSWEGQIGKLLPIDEKGRISNVGYLLIHDITSTEDGKTFVIGEGYAKQNSKISVTDIVLLQFNKMFDLEKAYLGTKANTTKHEYRVGLNNNLHTTALWMKHKGDFDYSFTQTTRNNTFFVVGYTDYDKSKNSKDIVFNSLTYRDQKIAKDKINFHSEASLFRLFPSKPGFLLLMEYFKKEKRLDLRLEKMN